MQVKDVVEVAKDYVRELFGADGLADLRLEEIERDRENVWNVTVGFARPLELATAETQAGALISRMTGRYGARVYRVVRINDGDGQVVSVKIREGLD